MEFLDGLKPSDPRAAVMYTLLRGLRRSTAFLPTAMTDAVARKSKIAHPGYEE